MYGAIGSGKTSILRRLYDELSEDDTYTLRLLIAPNIKAANSFLRAIMDAFGVPTDRAYERSLKRFEAFLLDQYQQSKVPTLFVDEAQNMTRDVLKLIHYLLNLETSEVKLLQIVLSGQEELAEKIKRYEELASRLIPIAINPMAPLDLEDMLKFHQKDFPLIHDVKHGDGSSCLSYNILKHWLEKGIQLVENWGNLAAVGETIFNNKLVLFPEPTHLLIFHIGKKLLTKSGIS